MKIKMLKSTPGAINEGLEVKYYKVGLVYDTADMMESVVKAFLDIKVAEIHESLEEVIRHQRGLSGAPENKREKVPENKVEVVEEKELEIVPDPEPENEDPDDGDDFFTLEELEGAKAGEIRALAEENDIDLSDFPKNTSAKVLINAFLDRQGE